MKKKIRINNDEIKKLVNQKLKQDGNSVNESKIDKAIKQYLLERKEGDTDPNSEPEIVEFTPKAKKTFAEMVESLYDIVEDIMIIQAKEPDVLVDVQPETYSEAYLGQLADSIEGLIEHLEFLRDFESEDLNL
jgi:hypothetical protein